MFTTLADLAIEKQDPSKRRNGPVGCVLLLYYSTFSSKFIARCYLASILSSSARLADSCPSTDPMQGPIGHQPAGRMWDPSGVTGAQIYWRVLNLPPAAVAEYYRRWRQVASLVLANYLRAGRATSYPTYVPSAGVLLGPA